MLIFTFWETWRQTSTNEQQHTEAVLKSEILTTSEIWYGLEILNLWDVGAASLKYHQLFICNALFLILMVSSHFWSGTESQLSLPFVFFSALLKLQTESSCRYISLKFVHILKHDKKKITYKDVMLILTKLNLTYLKVMLAQRGEGSSKTTTNIFIANVYNKSLGCNKNSCIFFLIYVIKEKVVSLPLGQVCFPKTRKLFLFFVMGAQRHKVYCPFQVGGGTTFSLHTTPEKQRKNSFHGRNYSLNHPFK